MVMKVPGYRHIANTMVKTWKNVEEISEEKEIGPVINISGYIDVPAANGRAKTGENRFPTRLLDLERVP